MSFPPLNLYTFAAARGQFLRPGVQALLKSASIGLYSDFANPHAPFCAERPWLSGSDWMPCSLASHRGRPRPNAPS
jgi:hypothetical protein